MNLSSLCICLILLLSSCRVSSNYSSPQNEKDIIDSTDITQNDIEYDTTLITILDTSAYLPPIMDFEDRPYKVFLLALPLDSDSISYVTNWIGVGEEAINDYAVLEQSISPEWAKSDVSVPIEAYSLGKPIDLSHDAPEDVCFCIGNLEQIELAKRGLKCDEELKIKSLNKELSLPTINNEELFLLLINENRVSGYNVEIKLIATAINSRN